MSRSSDSKSQVGDSNVTTTTGKLKVKTGGKKEKNVEEIMQDFLEEKDNEKWHYFVDKLGKRDSALLKRLLLSKCDEDSESDGRKHPKRECEEGSESDCVIKEKVPRRSERTKQQKIEETDSDSQKLKSRRKKETPMKKPSKNIKVEVIDSDSGEKKRRKQEDDVKNKIKKEKNGNQVQVKKEKTEEKQEVDKEYFVFINGEKQLVRVVTEQDRKQTENESDSSIKEAKQPKTLKPFYTVSDSDENEEKCKEPQPTGWEW